MNAGELASAIRAGAGLFALRRGLIEVTGSDRVRWLDGMLSNDVAELSAGPARSGCYATLLTPKGRIVADLHVLLRPEGFWLETATEAVATVMERLDRYIIADDVALSDRSAETARFGIEGPRAEAVLAAAGVDVSLAEAACCDAELGGASVVLARFGWSGAPGYQVFAAAGDGERVGEALIDAGAAHDLVRGDDEALEILRIEAGVPRLGPELDEDVFPAEARLDGAISWTKGCYTGQEIVARIESRGRVNHLLVGLQLGDGAVPPVGEAVFAGDGSAPGRSIGEITSACESPTLGPIALAYVRRAHAEPGTALSVAGGPAEVRALPFIASTSP